MPFSNGPEIAQIVSLSDSDSFETIEWTIGRSMAHKKTIRENGVSFPPIVKAKNKNSRDGRACGSGCSAARAIRKYEDITVTSIRQR